MFRVDVEALQDVGRVIRKSSLRIRPLHPPCVKALAGDEIVPTRITLDSTEEYIDVSNDWYDDGNGW